MLTRIASKLRANAIIRMRPLSRLVARDRSSITWGHVHEEIIPAGRDIGVKEGRKGSGWLS
jgi:hypothetical protein